MKNSNLNNIWYSIWHGKFLDSQASASIWYGIAYRFILPLIAIILAFIIALISYLIYKRSEEGMSALLVEKGGSLLNVIESALRTGMQGTAGLQLQVLLKEISTSHDIEFIAVTLPEGTIIAHSNQHKLGELLSIDDEVIDHDKMNVLDPDEKEKWLTGEVDGEKVFLVYRTFTMGSDNWDKDLPRPIVFLGMEASPFEITNSQNRSFVIILSITVMLCALCGLLALSFSQRALESRKRQKQAEGEVHRLEEEVRRNEKLAAIGTLAAGVAHEIRNPLSSIKGYATYFAQHFEEGSEDREAAQVMVKEVERLNRVITDLLGLSKPSDVKLQPIKIINVIRHVEKLISQTAQSQNIVIKVHQANVIPPILGDKERLSQAILNLCLNALQAMKDGGILDIAVSGGAKKICICIKDNGSGMDANIIKKIFDPYFTTRNSGTGLGLPMVHKIIKAHQGNILVTSKVAQPDSQGETIFKIWLPIATH